MEEEEILEKQEKDFDANDFVKKLNFYKENYVPKEQYEKVKADSEILADALLDGKSLDFQLPEVDDEQKYKDLNEVRDRLIKPNGNRNNLEIASDIIKLRDLSIELYGAQADPFLPKGSQVTITENDYTKAENVADVFKQCIEYAQGDSEVFTNELSRRTRDALPNYRN